ncbi:16117_t:CDS:2, partial [Dentiscutata erythropus]
KINNDQNKIGESYDPVESSNYNDVNDFNKHSHSRHSPLQRSYSRYSPLRHSSSQSQSQPNNCKILLFKSDYEAAAYVAERPELLKIAVQIAQYDGLKVSDNEEKTTVLTQLLISKKLSKQKQKLAQEYQEAAKNKNC